MSFKDSVNYYSGFFIMNKSIIFFSSRYDFVEDEKYPLTFLAQGSDTVTMQNFFLLLTSAGVVHHQ